MTDDVTSSVKLTDAKLLLALAERVMKQSELLSRKAEVTTDPCPIETLPNGSKQSKVDCRYDLFPPLALEAVSVVLSQGAEKYGVGNWKGIPADSHLNHAVRHVYRHLSGDRSEDHLEHAACRLLMALERKLIDKTWTQPESPR